MFGAVKLGANMAVWLLLLLWSGGGAADLVPVMWLIVTKIIFHRWIWAGLIMEPWRVLTTRVFVVDSRCTAKCVHRAIRQIKLPSEICWGDS